MNPIKKLWTWLKKIFSSLETEQPELPAEEPSEVPPANGEGTGRRGFNPDFLPTHINLPAMDRNSDALLHYRHFSVAMNPNRRLPYYTAVNIDAQRYNRLKDMIPPRDEMKDHWVLENRIPEELQLPESFYHDNDFDLGHMVRREDPIWGDTLEEAIAANEDTFHLTNAAPQHKDFNRSAQRWKGLEDYALKNAREHDLRLSVFSGCVFRDNDRKHRGVQIPGQFWKILVMVKKNGELSATGYVVQQDDLIQDITERGVEFQYEQFKTYQVPISKIEELTGLQFGLSDHDPLHGLRSVLEPKAIEAYEDIMF